MNIAASITFSREKPAVLPILKSEKLNLIAIGLLQNQLLKKHKTNLPTLLTVLKGTIKFRMGNESIRLGQYDTYSIPVNVEHEVEGVDAENVFTLTQEK